MDRTPRGQHRRWLTGSLILGLSITASVAAFLAAVQWTQSLASAWLAAGALFLVCVALAALVHALEADSLRAIDRAKVLGRDLQRLSLAVRISHHAVLVADADGTVTWVNPAACRLTGLDEAGMLGKPLHGLLTGVDDDPMRAMQIQSVLDHEQEFVARLPGVAADGRCYLADTEVRPIDGDSGAAAGLVAIQRDVTSLAAGERALAASQAFLERTGTLAHVAGWHLERESRHLSWTSHLPRLLGLDPEQPAEFSALVAPFAGDAEKALRASVEACLRSGEAFDLELPAHTSAAGTRWMRVVGDPDRNGPRVVGVHGAILDVDEQVRQRRHAQSERARLSTIIRSTGAATWEWNVATGELRLNERWAEMIGTTLADLGTVDIAMWRARMHPDDLPRAQHDTEAYLAGHSEQFECEFRMRHEHGHWVWVVSRGRIVTRTSGGQAEWLYGTQVDVSARKLAEIQLNRQRLRLETTLQAITDGVITADTQGHVRWMNPVAEHMTGWSTEHAQGLPLQDVLELVWREDGTPAPLRDWLAGPAVSDPSPQRHDGLDLLGRGRTRRAAEINLAPLCDEDGTAFGTVLVVHDVTERQRVLDELSHRARHDPLTGLGNRAAFDVQARMALEAVRRGDAPGALMFVDLDHFKAVNDRGGHQAGDALLRMLAERLHGCVRSGDLVARLGGDEFAVLLHGCDMDHARLIAQTMCETVADCRIEQPDGSTLGVGASIGLAPLDARWPDLEVLLRATDAACYVAKDAGRGCVREWSSGQAPEQLDNAFDAGIVDVEVDDKAQVRPGA